METAKVEKLSQFFEEIKALTFWKRLFHWPQVRSLSYEAYEEFKWLLHETGRLYQNIVQANGDIAVLKNDNEHLKAATSTADHEAKILKAKFDDSSARIADLSAQLAARDEAIRHAEIKQKQQEIELFASKEKINQLAQENSNLKQENTIFRQTASDRKTKYEHDVAALNSIREQIQNERTREIKERQEAEIARLVCQKETWAKHQDRVQEVIRTICQRHTIEYIDQVPFKGNPDNTIKICGEFVVFDAKSPASDDLGNFPTYIKTQTESVKKYIKEENVKKDIFLVIPANTVHVIGQFSFNMADYHVYIVTLEALEPLILSLKRLEEYEFVDQLTPEERDSICRVIGKFAHMTKRRIQIDQFFGRQFLEILAKCESDLPREVLGKVIEYERSEKLNPPLEKRAKIISSEELDVDNRRIERETDAKAIFFPASTPPDVKHGIRYDDDKPDAKES